MVYRTDAIAAGDPVEALPDPRHKQITTYPIVDLTQSKNAWLSQEFMNLVHGPWGQYVPHLASFGRPRQAADRGSAGPRCRSWSRGPSRP